MYKNTTKVVNVKIEYNKDFTGTPPSTSSEVEITLDYGQAEGGTIEPTNDYLVIYDCKTNGGEDCSKYNEYLSEGTKIDLSYTATKSGWTFAGWNTNKDATTGLTSLEMNNADVTLYAIYKKTINVSYTKGTGISAIGKTSDSCVMYNNATSCQITLPSITALTGYGVDGWYNSSNTKVGTEGTRVNVSGNITYTAKGKANSYTLTYNYNGATGGNSTTSKAVTYNSTYGTLPSPTRSYVVTYNYNSATSGNTTANATSNYTFNGWYKESTFSNQVTSSSIYNTVGNSTIYAKWTGTSIVLPTPTRTGYTFSGWYSDLGLTKKVGDGGSSYTPTSSLTLYAKWTDTTNPTCTLALSGTKGNGNWYKGDVLVTLTTADVGSGVKEYGLTTANIATYNNTQKVTQTADTTGTTYYGYVKDNAGNTGTCNIAVYKDAAAPVISSLNNTSGGNWTNQNVTITGNYRDGASGIDTSSVGYNYDNSSTRNKDWSSLTTTSVSGVWSAQRDNTVYFYVCDIAGNCSSATTTVKIDKTVPTVSLNPSAWATYVSGGKAVTVTLADAHSGLKASQPIYYAWTTSNTAAPTSWANVVSTNAAGAKSATVTVPATSSASLTGTYYLWIKAGTLADLSGNVSAKATSGAFKFDNNNPIISNLTASKTTNSITAVATASATSGISKYEFSKDNGATWVSSGTNKTYTFTGLTHNTTYPIKVRVTSGVGKQALSATTNVTTNRIDPPTYVVSPGGNLYTQSKEVTVTAYCTTCTNEYSIDNGKTWVVFPSTVFKIKYISNNVLMARSKDGTNTVSSTCTITNIDQTNPGFVKVNASSKVPGGYLPCDGRAVSRTTYANLFKAIGTTYGAGDGSTTFNLPDFQGRIPIGKSSKYALGSKGGSTDTTLATANLPAHTHTAIAKGTVSSTFTGSSAATASGGAHTHTLSGTTSSNGNHSHTTYHKGYYWINRGTGGEWKYLAYWEQIASDPEREFGRTSSNGAHTHTFSGTTSSNGAHTHTVTPKGSISNTFTGTSATTSSVGSGTSFTNMQPYSVIDYVIKY
ncbi:MAG: InlB B-repeat-containing protein [Bacilli bacterium]